MAAPILHMLAELFGIESYVPTDENKAHFSLERDAFDYTLDAQLQANALVLCLSRELLPYEENDADFLQHAARIAHKFRGIKAYNIKHNICFVSSIPETSTMDVLEQTLLDCIECQDRLREV